jgi:hypothetical protein
VLAVAEKSTIHERDGDRALEYFVHLGHRPSPRLNSPRPVGVSSFDSLRTGPVRCLRSSRSASGSKVNPSSGLKPYNSLCFLCKLFGLPYPDLRTRKCRSLTVVTFDHSEWSNVVLCAVHVAEPSPDISKALLALAVVHSSTPSFLFRYRPGSAEPLIGLSKCREVGNLPNLSTFRLSYIFVLTHPQWSAGGK